MSVVASVTICAIALCTNVANGQAITAITSTTPSQDSACPGVTVCMNDTVCSECLSLLLSRVAADDTPFFSINIPALWPQQQGFFFNLTSPTCFRNGTVVPLLSNAADDLFHRPCHPSGPNWPYLPVQDPCLFFEFNCALDSDCRQCMYDLYINQTASQRPNRTIVFNSPSCDLRGSGSNILQSVSNNCAAAFPQCTFSKLLCADDVTQICPMCLEMLRDGDVTNAMQQCSSTTGNSAALLGDVMFTCMSDNDVMCQSYTAQCKQNETCRNCLSVVGEARTPHDMAVGFLNTPSCMAILGNNTSRTPAKELLIRIFGGCPVTIVDACQERTALCILTRGEVCATCLAGTVSHRLNDQRCELFLATVNDACQPCPTSVYENNRIVLTTSIVGAISILPCLVVILIIIAYGKDYMYIRSRVIIGLMTSNIVYSIGNAIPVAMLQTSVNNCGISSLSFNTIRFGRAVWFAGKYALVFFELFILGVTVWALKSGLRKLGMYREAFLHVTCVVGGIIAFVVFALRSGQIESGGYNEATQSELRNDVFSYLGTNDDHDDDDGPSADAAQRFATARNDYNTLVQQMLQAWIAFLGMSILLWLILRWIFARLTKTWFHTLSEAEEQWDRDLWAPDHQAERQTKRRFLELIKEGYDELFHPLEPFVAVFVVFGIPACVMATDWCQEHSQVSASGNSWGSVAKITGGNCDVVCELVLSFRSIATVAVFFYSRENRNEIYHFRTMFRRLRSRVAGWFLAGERRHSSGVRFRDLLLEEVQMIPRSDDDDAAVQGAADMVPDTAAGATVPYKLMVDSDTDATESRDTRA